MTTRQLGGKNQEDGCVHVFDAGNNTAVLVVYVIGKCPIAPWLQLFKVILAKCLKRGSFGKMLKGFLRTGISVRWTNDFATIKNHPTWMYIIA